MRTACLLGNGVSIAYNPDLAVDRLTTELLSTLSGLSGGDAEAALRRFSKNLSMVKGDHFEALLGPLSPTSTALGQLSQLGPIAGMAPAKVRVSINRVQKFLADVHRVGLGTVLELIADHCAGSGSFDVTEAIAEALIGLGPARDLSIATLNYDGLTLAGLMEMGTSPWGVPNYRIADLASGLSSTTADIAPGVSLEGHWLRSYDDIPVDRAAVLHLHGYLGWLRDPDSGKVAKFKLEDLRAADYWGLYANSQTDWEPVVVLTDRKERATLEWPFSMAYVSFQQRLVDADHWLIAGYGFGDAPVNNLFKSALRARRRQRLGDPKVLVIDYGGERVRLRVRRALREIGIPRSTPVSLLGVPDALSRKKWKEFSKP